MESIMVEFLMPHYMSTPSLGTAPEALERGEEAEVELYTLFTRGLLEAAGVETAFVTVPGHVHMAFAPKAGAEDGRVADVRQVLGVVLWEEEE